MNWLYPLTLAGWLAVVLVAALVYGAGLALASRRSRDSELLA